MPCFYYPINKDVKIPMQFELETLNELKKGIEIMNLNTKHPVKPNMSEIARDLGVDRRTATRYYHNGPPSPTRKRGHLAAKYKHIITSLLLPSVDDKPKRFFYIRHLFHYMQDNYGMEVSESAFRRYILSKPEFAACFGKSRGKSARKVTVRYETKPGDLAQLDWKESIPMEVTDPDIPPLSVNVMVLKLACSRKTIFHLTVQRTQDVLFSALTEAFEHLGGVPKRIMVDNMKTVMDKPRTLRGKGIVNTKFQEFAKDFGFEVVPCIARRPCTKGKVESVMKIVDEIRAYSGELTYKELVHKVNMIAQRYNMTPNQATGLIPDAVFNEQEKGLLLPLPRQQIRDHYKILKGQAQVNTSSMVHYQCNQYSVPPQYVGKTVNLSVLDGSLYLYHNTELVTVHRIKPDETRERKNIYLPSHEKAIWKAAFPNMKEEDYRAITKNNLSQLGDLYRDDK